MLNIKMKADDPARLLAEGIEALHLDIPAEVQAKLLDYVALLAKWNRAYNLTAVRRPAQMVVRHLLDSLAVLPYLHGERVLDVGSGAGLPGIPLALASPRRHFTLLDSNGKKARFLVQAVAALRLDNADVVQCRVADFHPDAGYSSIVSRAFSGMAELIDQAAHLLAPDGRFLFMKGVYPQAEVAALPAGWELEAVHRLAVPGLDAERHLLVVRASAD